MKKNGWNNIENKKDIDNLLNVFDGFHDSLLISANYKSGNCISEEGGMFFGESQELSLLFQSQTISGSIELMFSGVIKFNLLGKQEGFSSEILDCYLDFKDEKIIFADSSDFNIKKADTTFVIAEKLAWRMVDTNETNI